MKEESASKERLIMKKLTGLSIVECPYGEVTWKVDKESPDFPNKILSELEILPRPRETDDYQLCGVYYKAGVPFHTRQIVYKPLPGEEVYESITREFSNVCCEELGTGNALLVAGGYCTFSPGIVGGIQRAIGRNKKIGIVWLDAHGDIFTPEDAKFSKGSVAGLPLSTLTGLGFQHWRDVVGLEQPCDGRNVILADYRKSDTIEDAHISEARIVCLKTDEFKDSVKWKKAVNAMVAQVDVIYLQVDADILHPDHVPAYIYTVTEGNDVETVKRNIKTVMDTGKVLVFSMMCVCFDTPREGKDLTYLNGMRMVGAGLEHWKECPSFE